MRINNNTYRYNKDGSLDKRYRVVKIENLKVKRIQDTNRRIEKAKDTRVVLATAAALLSFYWGFTFTNTLEPRDMPLIRPLATAQAKTITQHFKTYKYSGVASYYSHDGCIGCRSDQLMANGQPFKEMDLTLASNDYPLNTMVRVTNKDNGLTTIAQVTDTGGFNELGRIADLSLGVKNRLQCTDLCNVSIINVEVLK